MSDEIEVNEIIDTIKHNLNEITAIEGKVSNLRDRLVKFAPFNIGDTLVGNDYTHTGKEFVCDSISAKYNCSSLFRDNGRRVPVFFVASGYIKTKSGKTGKQRTQRHVKIFEEEK